MRKMFSPGARLRLAPAQSAVAVFVLMALCAPAHAAPVTVQLRVEGSTSTIFEGPISTDGKQLDKGGGPHPCDGTNGGINPTPGPTMTSALDDASLAAGFPWQGTWFDSFGDFGIDSVGTDANDFGANRFWGYALNFVAPDIGGCQKQVQAGDQVLFGYDFFSKAYLLKLSGTPVARVNEPVNITVTDGKTGSPVGGASVAGKTTRADGHARLAFGTPGLKSLKAERPDSLRSNELLVCIASAAGGDCGVPASALGGETRQTSDTTAPSARISSPRNGRRYRRGPRLLRGTASDDGGVKTIRLALRRSGTGKGCSWWSGSRERFVRSGCRKAKFFSIEGDASWSYLLPSALKRGRYRLDVTASDRVGNAASEFRRGRNRVVFQVRR
jgi:hypothetical protein